MKPAKDGPTGMRLTEWFAVQRSSDSHLWRVAAIEAARLVGAVLVQTVYSSERIAMRFEGPPVPQELIASLAADILPTPDPEAWG